MTIIYIATNNKYFKNFQLNHKTLWLVVEKSVKLFQIRRETTMDPTAYSVSFSTLACISVIASIGVLIVGCTCYPQDKMLRIVFPYIRKSGNHNVIYGFIIPNIRFHFYHVVGIVAITLLDALFNALIITSNTHNPYDGLDCFGYCKNGSIIKLESEEQAKMDNVTHIRCYGWNTDIAGGIGHAGAILTLAWVFISITLWVKLNLYYKARNSAKNKICFIKALGYFGYIILFLFQFFLIVCTLGAIIGSCVSVIWYNLPLKEFLEIGLISTILLSGLFVFPGQKKAKTLEDCCKEAVENNKRRQEEDIEKIKERLTERVQGHQIQVDLLLEMAKLECKKALADIYYYGNEQEKETVSEEEMKTIAQVAYGKIVPPDEQTMNNVQNIVWHNSEPSHNITEKTPLLRNANEK